MRNPSYKLVPTGEMCWGSQSRIELTQDQAHRGFIKCHQCDRSFDFAPKRGDSPKFTIPKHKAMKKVLVPKEQNPSNWTEPELEEHRLKWKEIRSQKMQLPLICFVYTKTDGVMTIYSSFEDYDKAQTAAKNLSKKVSDVVGVESTHDSVSGGFAHFQGGKPVKRPRGHDYLYPVDDLRSVKQQGSMPLPEKLLERKRNPLNPSSLREMLSERIRHSYNVENLDDTSSRMLDDFIRRMKPNRQQLQETLLLANAIMAADRADGKSKSKAAQFAEAIGYSSSTDSGEYRVEESPVAAFEKLAETTGSYRVKSIYEALDKILKPGGQQIIRENPSPKYFYIQGRDDARAGNKARSLAEFEQRYASQVRETSWAMPNDLYREYLNGAADAVQDIPSQGGSERVAEIMREFRAKGGRVENPAAIRRQDHGFNVSIYEGTYSGRKQISFSAFSVAEGFANTFNATAKEEAKGSNTYYVEVEGGYDTRDVAGMGWASARKTIVANNLSKRDAKAKLEELWRGFLQGEQYSRQPNPSRIDTDAAHLWQGKITSGAGSIGSSHAKNLKPMWTEEEYLDSLPIPVKEASPEIRDFIVGDSYLRYKSGYDHVRFFEVGPFSRGEVDREIASLKRIGYHIIDKELRKGKYGGSFYYITGALEYRQNLPGKAKEIPMPSVQSSKGKRNPIQGKGAEYADSVWDSLAFNERVSLIVGAGKSLSLAEKTAERDWASQSQMTRIFLEGLIGSAPRPWSRETHGKRNPESSSASVYEEFHGKPSESVLDVEFEEHEHEHLAALGTLVQIVIITPFKKEAELNAPDPNESPVEDHVLLCSNEEKTQLYLVGGDQSLNDEFLEKLGFKQDKNDFKDFMVLGLLKEVTYRTEKGFDKFKSIDYYHELGEETGMVPVLIYDYRSGLLRIAGGQYEIKDVGIVN